MSAALLYDIAIERGLELRSPDMPQISVAPDSKGRPAVEIKIIAPTKAMDGSYIDHIDRLSCWMDGELLNEKESLEAGESYTISVTDEEPRYHNFTFVASNGYGDGQPLVTKIYLGINKPSVPENITAKEDGDSGKVVVKWDKVETDVDGYAIIPEFVSYKVFADGKEIASGLKDCEFIHQAVATGEQAFIKYSVEASTVGGKSELMGESPYIFVGKSYTLPFVESFKGGRPAYYFLTEGFGQWQTAGSYGYLTGDGCIVYVPNFIGSKSALISGKISLEDAVQPELSFAMLCNPANNDVLDVEVVDAETQEVNHLATTSFDTSSEWVLRKYSLNDYAGKTIMLRFQILTNQKDAYSMLDEIKIVAETSAVTEIESDLEIEVDGDRLEVKSQGPIWIYTLDGRVVTYADDFISITLPEGIYLIKIGGVVKKVFIK